jgi:glycosyltransferase involved in cell wall biosynthesis
MLMRVGLDATYLLQPHKSGVETYTLNLVRALLGLPERPEVFLYAAGPERPADAEPLLAAADRARLSSVPRLWLRLRMPLLMAWDRVTVAHFPGTLLPLGLPCPAVTTFYDLAALHYPELYDPSELGHYEALIPSAARRSAAIIAISECTKRDLVERMGVPETKVHVTPLGVDARFRPVPDADEVVRDRYCLDPPYVLACVGSGHPRKNLRGVVEAFSRLASPDTALAIVGTAERDPAAQLAVEASPARDRIVRLGHVPEADLPAIYSAAAVFCFPSLYEGFGLPVLEAMACGTPVIGAGTSSLPEVGGDVAVYIDPTDPEALAAALGELLGDEARRRDLGARGVAWARRFTWERTATLTLRAYQAAEATT